MLYRYFLLFLIFISPLSAMTQQEQINMLLKEVQELKTSLKKLQSAQNEQQQEIIDNADYTERVETNTLEDKINFGFGFKVNLDNFDKTYIGSNHQTKNVDNPNIWSIKFMLNMKATISDNMNFYARLSMYKYFGSAYVHPYSNYDNMQGRVPDKSVLLVERAYINWFFNKSGYIPFALTIGRQPSSDGPSNQLKDNLSRKGTYSALLYDGAADGLVGTFDLSKVVKLKKSYLRFGYAKGYGLNETALAGNAFVGSSKTGLKDTNMYGVFFDTTVPKMRSSLIQLSYSKMVDIVANPADYKIESNKNIGDVDLFGVMVEMENIKRTHLDLFAQYGYSITHPNSQTYGLYGGLLSSDGATSTHGDVIWAGGKYGFGRKQMFKIGAEYNHGSKNWINLTQGAFDIYNKLATRGDAYEAYLMYIINRYANIRLGYIRVDYDYTGSGWFVGEPVAIDNVNATDENMALKQLQSIYLKMSVKY